MGKGSTPDDLEFNNLLALRLLCLQSVKLPAHVLHGACKQCVLLLHLCKLLTRLLQLFFDVIQFCVFLLYLRAQGIRFT